MSVDHYENFPVASWLCPPALRAPIAAIYWYARHADDLADEGDASPAQRLADLAQYRADLHAVATGRTPSARWAGVFAALGRAIERHRLPLPLLEALLDAFEQDVARPGFADRAALLDYCSRSANPVGRLLLHLYGVDAPAALRESDAICSALQLINFWQDLGTDLPRGRLNLPEADCARHGLGAAAPGRDRAAAAALLAELCAWARALMAEGAPLVHRLPGRVGWELRLVVQGGLAVLGRVEALGPTVLERRPRLHAWQMPALLWRAGRM